MLHLVFRDRRGDGFRESGFSKERRLEPQITIGLLTGADGFPLMVSAFEGNKAETKTMLPVIESFMAAHQLPDVTVVADAGMVTRERTRRQIEAAGLSFILGARSRTSRTWSRSGGASTPARRSPTGRCSPSPGRPGRTAAAATRSSTTSTRPTGPAARCAASTSRSPRPSRPSPGKTPVKRNRFVRLSGGTRTVNRELEDKARALAGLKGYVTNLRACPDGTPVTPEFVIGAYHQLFQIEKSFRMAKSDLQARPIYHRKRDSIEAHLTIVLAALAVSRWIEHATGWSIRKFVKTARRYRTIQIQAGDHVITAADAASWTSTAAGETAGQPPMPRLKPHTSCVSAPASSQIDPEWAGAPALSSGRVFTRLSARSVI